MQKKTQNLNQTNNPLISLALWQKHLSLLNLVITEENTLKQKKAAENVNSLHEYTIDVTSVDVQEDISESLISAVSVSDN